MIKRQRFALLCACMVFILTGCQGSQKDAAAAGDGVYLSKIEESAVGGVYNPLAGYLYSLLHYGNQMYASSLTYVSTNQSDLNLDAVLGDALAPVSGNHGVYWSTDGGELSELTYEGTLYRVKGYEEDFRIAVCYESAMPLADTYYHLIIFDCLNDIWLKTGGDLFDDRLHLSEAVRVEGAMYGDENSCDLSGNAVVEEFLAALYDGEVLETASDAYSASDAVRSCVLFFYDSAGLVTDIRVYENGRAVMEYNGNKVIVVKMNEEECKELISILE